MKYPEHINDFWRMRRADGSLTNTDMAVYFYLCDCLNADFWRSDRVTQRREVICGFLSIGASALEESRNRLKQKGLIDFVTQTQVNKSGKKQGVKGSSTVYIVLNSELVSAQNSVPDRTLNRHQPGTNQALNSTVLEKEIVNENLNENKKKEGGDESHLLQKMNQMEQELKALKEDKEKEKPPRCARPPKEPEPAEELQFPYASPAFMQLWGVFIKMKKQRTKPIEAKQAMLLELAEFDEEYAISLLRKSIAGNYQGLTFSDTKDQYEKHLARKNGTSKATGKESYQQVESTVDEYFARRFGAQPN